MRAIEAVTPPGETAALCQSVGVSRASLYRRRRSAPPSTPTRPRAPSPRALGTPERQAVLDVLHSERFVDQAPAAVHATLLEEQTYLCSPRTMYRVLAAARAHFMRYDSVDGAISRRRPRLAPETFSSPQTASTIPFANSGRAALAHNGVEGRRQQIAGHRVVLKGGHDVSLPRAPLTLIQQRHGLNARQELTEITPHPHGLGGHFSGKHACVGNDHRSTTRVLQPPL